MCAQLDQPDQQERGQRDDAVVDHLELAPLSRWWKAKIPSTIRFI